MKNPYLKVSTAQGEVLVEGTVPSATITSSHVSWDDGENSHSVALSSTSQVQLIWPAP